MHVTDRRKHHGEHSFAQHQQAVARREKIAQLNANEGIDHSCRGKSHDGKQRHRGVAAHCHIHVGAKAAAVGNKSHEPTDPQHNEEEVEKQGIRAIVVVTAGRGVAFQPERNSKEQRQEEHAYLPRPCAGKEANEGHKSGNTSGKQPDLRRRNLPHRHAHQLRVEHLGNGRACQVRHHEGNLKQGHPSGADGSPGAGAGSNVAVNGKAGPNELIIVLIWHGRVDEESTGHERANRKRHQHPRGCTEEGKAEGGDAAWVRDAQRRERVREEKQRDNSADKTRKNDKRKIEKAGRLGPWT